MRLVTEPYRTDAMHDGRNYEIKLDKLTFYRCDECKSVVLPDEANDRIGRELRACAGLMMPEEIKAGRLRLGLSQRQLAEQFGVAEATVNRWEKGGQIQQAGYDRALGAFFEVKEMRDYYRELLTLPRIPRITYTEPAPNIVVSPTIQWVTTQLCGQCIVEHPSEPEDENWHIDEIVAWNACKEPLPKRYAPVG